MNNMDSVSKAEMNNMDSVSKAEMNNMDASGATGMMEHISAGRLKKLRVRMAADMLDAVLITKRENYIYLSGFNGTAANLLITQSGAVLITDFRYVEQAAEQAPLYKIVQYSGNLNDTIYNELMMTGAVRLGFESGHITYEKYSEYLSKLKKFELIPMDGIVEKLRIKKEPDEIESIKHAVDLADEAFQHILDFVKPGVREIELAAELEYFMMKNGAKGASFETIAASGIRSSMPHGTASQKILAVGDALTLDFGALLNDYCSDITRTVFLGKPDEELRKIYNIVLEAQKMALAAAEEGLSGKEADSIARRFIEDHGYGKFFGHGLGHGVGLEIHEEPRLSQMGNTNLESGMVVTIEPGIYLPAKGGVRIEDLIVIRGSSPLILTQAEKELIIL